MPSPEYSAGRMIAGSWPEGNSAESVERLIASFAEWNIVRGPGWFIASEKKAFSAGDDRIIVSITNVRIMDREAAILRDAPSLLGMLQARGEHALDDLAAPFRLLYVDRAEHRIVAATDPSGLGQMFMAASGGISLCGSSATLLAEMVGARPCLPSLAAFAQCGSFPFELTPFEGVTKLMAGSRLTIVGGQSRIYQVDNRPAAGDIRTGFVAAVGALLQAAPDASLELSGGLDSRLILAAIPETGRAGRRAVTLGSGSGDNAEVKVARRIAQMTGLEHEIVPPILTSIDSADDLSDLLRHVAEGYDHMANPLDKVALVLAGRSIAQERPRFGGQNGEIIRGFYYPLQAIEKDASAAHVDRLVDWRLMANDRVAPWLFSAQGKLALVEATDELKQRLASFDGQWGKALDRIYLRYRMQSWAGAAVSNRFIGHSILWPFFDERFLAAAMALPPDEKQGSFAAYRMLAALDPKLAEVPLDNGVVPIHMLQGRMLTALQGRLRKMMKATRKIGQRLRPASTAVLGSDALLEKWHDLGCFRTLDVAGLAKLGLFNEASLVQIISGARRADRATLGFLLLCDHVVRNGRCAMGTSS